MRFRPTPMVLLGMSLVLASLSGCGRRTAEGQHAEQPAPGRDPVAEEVHFRHADDLLAGTLYRPGLPGPHPAIALVLGSGEHDRNYGGIGPALGRHFARNGFACLVWDKPGVGRSTGDLNTQTFPDRAEESLAAVRFLRGRPEIRADQVGLWGHSQGGAVVPLAASLSADVAFLIQVSGWQGPAWRQDLARVEAELRADGSPEADVEAAVAFARRRMDLILGTGPYEELERAQEEVKDRPWFRAVHFCDRARFDSGRLTCGHDTAPSWEKVHCPVLVIYGDRDTSSGPPGGLVAIIRGGLARAGNDDVTVRIFPGADHSLCRAGKQEAAREPDFVPGYLDEMTDWLARRFRTPSTTDR
jgi:pimeloyl-ACP methyl ester carboxylesterase